MGETTYYREGGLWVTEDNVTVGGKTYHRRSIIEVALKREHSTIRFLGGLALLFGGAIAWLGIENIDYCLAIMGVGAMLFGFGVMRVSSKYAAVMKTRSGSVTAYSSEDKEKAQYVVDAIANLL